MGSPESEKGRGENERQHEVGLSPFLIAKYEVTQGEWRRLTANSRAPFDGDNFPARGISWIDCQTFCEKTRLNLPTEAQWEYACRAGSDGPYAGDLDEVAWRKGNTGRMVRPVGQKKPNSFGLFDMQGNATEWCVDQFDDNFYSRAESAGPDPLCRSGSEDRVNKGGCAFQDELRCRSAYRGRDGPSDTDSDLGFRAVFNLR